MDDEYGRRLAEAAHRRSHVVTYGLEQGDFHAEGIVSAPQGNTFVLATPEGRVEVRSPLAGRVNVYNVIAASAAARLRGCGLEQIAAGVAALGRVPGRVERVERGQPFTVVVDYAHTDDALRNLVRLGRELASYGHGRVITVFGCGGQRDRGKRPRMGLAAGEGSDWVILTSDNPRGEDPLAIIEDSLPGVRESGVRFATEPDRRKAIALALSEAAPGDIVLIAGKGHEQTQATREGVISFDDREVAAEELNRLGYLAGGGEV